jgi:hypothetical protein
MTANCGWTVGLYGWEKRGDLGGWAAIKDLTQRALGENGDGNV